MKKQSTSKHDKLTSELPNHPLTIFVFPFFLLVIMTLTVVAKAASQPNMLIPITVTMKAVSDSEAKKLNLAKGELGTLKFNDTEIKVHYQAAKAPGQKAMVDVEKTFQPIRRRIINVLSTLPGGPGGKREDQELTIRCDPNLRYENVVRAITYASGFKSKEDGKTFIKLIEIIHFRPTKTRKDELPETKLDKSLQPLTP